MEQQFYAHSRRRCATERQKKANLYDRITGSRGILKAHLEKQVACCVSPLCVVRGGGEKISADLM